jgi:hypothetical protein
MPRASPRTAAARKIQAIFRKKRVFTQSSGIKLLNRSAIPPGLAPNTFAYLMAVRAATKNADIKFSKSTIVSFIASIKANVDIPSVLELTPKGFKEIAGYTSLSYKPTVRYTGGEWVGEESGVKFVSAKLGKLTILLSKDEVRVSGSGNMEQVELALQWCHKNGWITARERDAKLEFKTINGKFSVNHKLSLEDLADVINNSLPKGMLASKASFNYEPEIKATGLKNLTVKLAKPKFTYQFFENGTVLFSGIKNLADLEVPKQLFIEIFTEYGGRPNYVFNFGKKFVFAPTKAGNNKARLAARYPSAGSWNALVSPVPRGYYIRPGTNGQPRLYPYQFYRQLQSGPAILESEVDLKPLAPKVLKAFKNAGKNIPESTKKIFRNAGASLNEPAENKKTYSGVANRRAPSWNSTKPGFYVRPGPGQQPYWYKVPAGVTSGRKTVVAAYQKAGRNIPAAVREIFKIGNNVTVNAMPNHNVKMGLNGILRVNGRQATRLTQAELLSIARNLGIAQVNAKMAPGTIIAYIQRKAGAVRAARNFNFKLGNTKYKFGLNYRIERTTGKTQTTRAWNTFPANERNALVNAIVPANMRANFNSLPYKSRYEALFGFLSEAKAKPAPPSPARPSSVSSNNSNLGNLANFAAELENSLRANQYKGPLVTAIGNYYRNGNEANLQKLINALPSTAKGNHKKANINRTIKEFSRSTVIRRRQELIRQNFNSKLQVPNWLPNSYHANFRKTIVNFASTPNQKGKFPTQKAIKNTAQAWVNVTLPRLQGRPAYEKENIATGKVIKVPAYVPPTKAKVNVPKRISPNKPARAPAKPRAAPKPKPNARLNNKYRIPFTENVENLGNAMIGAGLNTKNAYTWRNLVQAGVNKKFKNTWVKHVMGAA